MAAEKGHKEEPVQKDGHVYRRIGHKGADTITPGNTIESFIAAVEQGVDMVEIDVLRDREGRLVIAHDHHDALSRRPLDLTDALDAFHEKPLDQVEIDCDLKLPGREAELAGALAGHGMVERAMVSTMEIESLQKLRQLEPDLRLGWTYPKTRRDWTSYGWARVRGGGRPRGDPPPVPRDPRVEGPGARTSMRSGRITRSITPRLVEAANQAERRADRLDGGRPRPDRELAEMGVHGDLQQRPAAVRGRRPRPGAG